MVKSWLLAQPWVRKSLVGYGDALLKLQQYNDAKLFYEQFIDRGDSDDALVAEVHFKIGQASELMSSTRQGDGRTDNDDLERAREEYERVLKIAEDKPALQVLATRAKFSLATVLYDLGKFDGSSRYLAELIAQSAEHSSHELIAKLANCYLRLPGAALMILPLKRHALPKHKRLSGINSSLIFIPVDSKIRVQTQRSTRKRLFSLVNRISRAQCGPH